MPISRPSLQTLINRITGDIQGGIDASAPLLSTSVLSVLGRVFAGSCHLLWGYLQWISRQVMPDTAESEHLERWAAIYGIYRTPASFAEGDLTVSGDDGITLAAGTYFVASGGTEYVSLADATTAGGSATVNVRAVTAGSIGTLQTGQVVQLLQPVAGIDSEAVTAATSQVPGVDAESDTALRVRLLKRIQDPPQGGSHADYIEWMLACPDISILNAWCYPNYAGAGTVGITFSVVGGPVPTSGQVATMASYIAELAPVTADVICFAPTLVEVDCTISVVPSTVSIKALVEASLSDFFANNGAPGSTLYLSQMNEAIASVPGVVDHSLTVPGANVVLATNELAALGDVTWI